MPILACLVAVLSFTALPIGTSDDTSDDIRSYRPVVDRILSASLQSGQAYTRLQSLCTKAPHRLAGSQGLEDAVEWALDVMREDGLQNVRAESCSVPHWVRGPVTELRIVSPESAAGDLPVLTLGGSVASHLDGITAEVVELHSFEELYALGDDISGKIAFFNRPMDSSLPNTFTAYGGAVDQRAWSAARAGRLGAVASVVRSMTTRLDDVPHTGGMRYEDDGPRVPSVAVSTRGADRISELLEQGESVKLFLKTTSHWEEDAESANVIGELVGSERPDEILVVGGHIDGWDVGQGAHDDGSGCVQALEAVRLLSELGLRPKRTIRVVLFTNEENGLGGARAYHAAHADSMDRHVFALESDRGGFTPRGFTTNANPEARAILEAIVGMFADVNADLLVTGSGGADVNVMRDDGVVVAGYLPDGHRYFDVHHSDNDTIDQVNPRELNLGAGLMAALLYVLADLEETLPRNPVEK